MTRTQRNFKNRPTRNGRDDVKPAVIIHENGEIIHAPDHDTRNGWVIIYRAGKPGVDRKIPRERVVDIDRIHDDGDDQDVPVAPGVEVEYRGEPWSVIEIRADGTHALLDPRSDAARDMCPTRDAIADHPVIGVPIDEVTVTDPVADSDDRLVADGGWTEFPEAPECNRCGGKCEDLNASICYSCAGDDSAEIRENADVEPGDCVVYTGSIEELQDSIWVFDDYACWHTATLINGDGDLVKRVDVRDLVPVPDDRADEKPEPPYASYDVENHHSNDGELVADGGAVIEPGDYVNYAGRTWRAGRVNDKHVEVYADGEIPRPVPVSDVEPANGGDA